MSNNVREKCLNYLPIFSIESYILKKSLLNEKTIKKNMQLKIMREATTEFCQAVNEYKHNIIL